MQVFKKPIPIAIAASVLMVCGLSTNFASSSLGEQPALDVVVNVTADVTTLSPAELAAIFSGIQRNWGNGRPIKVFNLEANSPERVAFDQVVLRMTPEQVSQYWIDRLVRGEGGPPTQVPRAELAARVVASLPGAIGYVRPDVVDARTRIVARVRNGKVTAR